VINALSFAFLKSFLFEESKEKSRIFHHMTAAGCLSFDFLIVGGGFTGAVIAEGSK
jgi:hypothetical protein